MTVIEAPSRVDERFSHIRRLEAESIAIIREVAACFQRPVLLYSIGKDSSVLLHLAQKAFAPAPLPFPVLHVDTGWKFREMIAHRDSIAARLGFELLVHTNEEAARAGITPFTASSAVYNHAMKTEGLKQAMARWGFDAAIGGARRDEEKSRAKERIFSHRNQRSAGSQRRSGRSSGMLGTRASPPASRCVYFRCQIGPSATSGTTSGSKASPSFLFTSRTSARRPAPRHLDHGGRRPHAARGGRVPRKEVGRFRSIGCYPYTGAIDSTAATLADILLEMRSTRMSERQGRLIDHDQPGSMERKKQEGYF